MGIKRYTAIADTSITNAYKEDLANKAENSNMGQADSLEVFKIYGQESDTSLEEARILIQFPVSGTTLLSGSRTIEMDRAAGLIPAAGSVKFYLKMFDVEHPFTLPSNYKLVVRPINKVWQEGLGIDLDEYRDYGAASWLTASTTAVQEITKVTFTNQDRAVYGAGAGVNYLAFYDSEDNQYNFWFNDTVGDSAPGVAGTTDIQVALGANDGNPSTHAESFKTIVDGQSQFGATRDGAIVYVTASSAGEVTGSAVSGTLSGITLAVHQSGSDGTPWSSAGGDFTTAAKYVATQDFLQGYENLEVEITDYVEDIISDTLSGGVDYGLGIQLTGTLIDDSNSYYTKRFSARSSEYFFNRPVIEARWNSVTTDDRGNFHYSSSLVSAAENLNTLYLYNFVNGKLTNIPAGNLTSSKLYVKIYASSNNSPTGNPLTLIHTNNDDIHSESPFVVTGGVPPGKTGIYTASFAMASQSHDTLHDLWYAEGNEFHTGTFYPKDRRASNISHYNETYAAIKNLKDMYYNTETARIRVYTRKKGWNPTVYTKATSEPELLIMPSASFSIYRIVDNLEVFPHDTGSDLSTLLSYDVSGSYFDLDMSMLEPNYSYGIKLAFWDDNTQSYVENKNIYKFRVGKHES